MTRAPAPRVVLGPQGFTLGVAILTTVLAYAVALLIGPVPVWVGLEQTVRIAPPSYLASAGLPFGILMAEALIDFRYFRFTLSGLLPLFMLLLLIGFGTIRFPLRLPISGHGLIVAYFLLHHLQERREGKTWKLLIGLLVLVHCAYYKLFVWNDPSSLLIGIGLGFFAWGIERAIVLVLLLRARGRNREEV